MEKKTLKKNDKKMIEKINNGFVSKEDSDISSGDNTDEEVGTNNPEETTNMKVKVTKYAKIDDKIKQKKLEKNKIMAELKIKYELSKYNEEIKTLNEEKIKLEEYLVKYLEQSKSEDPEIVPTINLGDWGTLKLVESKKKDPIKIELIEKSLKQVCNQENTFSNKKNRDIFITKVIEQIEENRNPKKKYLKKVK